MIVSRGMITGPMAIPEVATDGKYITLENMGSFKEV